MTRRAAPLLILISALLSGCISAYRYESRGVVESARGERRGALLYYYEDDGRLWYGKPYRARDSDADLRVCGATDATFVPTSESELLLALKSRGGDERVAGLAAEGGLVAVSPPRRLRPGSPCGHLLVDGERAGIEALDEGMRPTLVILCANPRRPDRYPAADAYVFGPLTRTRVGGEREPVGPCPP